MKLTITILFTAASWFSTFGQNVPIDFETTGFGALWNWTVFENTTNPPLEIVTNPDMTGANTSCTVAKFTALQTGQPWAGCESMHGADLGSFTLDASNSTINILVWKSVISDVGIKLVTPTNAAMVELKVPNTVTNQWELITFDFSGYIGQGPYASEMVDQVVIFPDFDLGGRAQDNVVYFDHVYGDASTIMSCSSCVPVNSLPTPDIMSLNDITSTCEVSSLIAPTATDSCGTSIVGVHNVTLPITAGGTSIVTWTYTDVSGNETTQMQNVIIDLNSAPVPDIAMLSDVMANCEVTSLTAPTAADGCGTAIIGVGDTQLPITTVGTTVVTWTYTDAIGNEFIQTQNIVITCNVGIEDIETSILSVYPNPSENLITISMSKTFTGHIMVTDLVGRELMNESFNSDKVILDLTRLPTAGTYFAKIIDTKEVVLGVTKIVYR